MKVWHRLVCGISLASLVALGASRVRAEGNGQADLDEALRVKITAEGLRELNQVIELLESSLDKGLDVENSDFAEQVLSESLMERATQLASVVEQVPDENLTDERILKVRALAISDLRRVIMYDNPPPQGLALLAKMLAMPGGDRREARGLLDKLIDGESFSTLPVADQADALSQRAKLQRDAKKALADFARAIELAPDNADFRLAKAQYQFDHEMVDDALTEVAAIVEKTPDQAGAYLLQAQILRALKRYDDALASLEKVEKLAPDSIAPHEYRGEIYREMEQFDKAVDEFTAVLKIEPGLALALIRRAEAYYFLDKLDDALADVNLVLKNNPGLGLAHGLRAQILAAQKKFGDAIVEMKQLADDMPGESDVKMQLALYYLLNDQTRDAIAEYSKVIDLDAEDFTALRSRGDAYLNLGDHAAAIEDFERAFKLKSDDSPLLNNFAWVLATSPDDNVRDGKRAIELATKACELTEYKKPHILSTLAAAYAESGDFENARKWSQQAVDMHDPENGPELEKELASYKDDKPWRERQTIDEGAGGDESKDPAGKDGPAAGGKSADDAKRDDSKTGDASDEGTPATDGSASDAQHAESSGQSSGG
jgi:tetratricopeptide (TPR) repeat protein